MLSEATTIKAKGIFKEECSNRFLCKVNLAEQEQLLCYVPSSARLTNFISLLGRTVCISGLQNGVRTKLSLLAREDGEWYTLLNLNIVNSLIKMTLQKERRYRLVGIQLNKLSPFGYRCDLTADFNRPEYFEIKGLLSDNQHVDFPSMKVERAQRQLQQILEQLKSGKKFTYVLALLNPTIKTVKLNDANAEYKKLFNECVDNGMRIRVYRLDWRVGGAPNFVRARNTEKIFIAGLRRCHFE